jgi:hypothetical protein
MSRTRSHQHRGPLPSTAQRLRVVKRWSGVLIALMACCLPRSVDGESAPIQLAIVVAPGTQLSNITWSDLKRVYMADTVTSDDGKRLVPINHPPRTADRVAFDQLVLGRDADGVGRFWIDQRIRGGSGPPRSVDNVMMLRQVVAKLPGAIAYLRPALLTAEVKAIRVDGKLAGEPGYPLEYRP